MFPSRLVHKGLQKTLCALSITHFGPRQLGICLLPTGLPLDLQELGSQCMARDKHTKCILLTV